MGEEASANQFTSTQGVSENKLFFRIFKLEHLFIDGKKCYEEL